MENSVIMKWLIHFSLADELKCLFMFIKALPHRPIVPMYPEAPFLFFKGVLLPRSFDLTEEMAMILRHL